MADSLTEADTEGESVGVLLTLELLEAEDVTESLGELLLVLETLSLKEGELVWLLDGSEEREAEGVLEGKLVLLSEPELDWHTDTERDTLALLERLGEGD